jgi:hypothetical protein
MSSSSSSLAERRFMVPVSVGIFIIVFEYLHREREDAVRTSPASPPQALLIASFSQLP